MLPGVNQNFQQQPLVKKMYRSSMQSAQKSRQSIIDALNPNKRSTYQNYRKQHQQSDEIPVMKLFFRNQESRTRNTPQSLFITKHVQTPLESKPSTTLDDTKYQEKIDFHSRKLRFDNYAAEMKMNRSYKSFKLQANVCQRPIMTAPKRKSLIIREKYRKIIVTNQLFLNTNYLQYQFMLIPDQSCSDMEKFHEFEQELRNRMKLNGKKLYFYLKDGTPVYSHLDIPPEEKILIYSTSTVFKSISNKQLDDLEKSCQPSERVSKVMRKPKPDYSQEVDGIINILVNQNYKSIEDVITLENADEEVEVTDNYMDSKELKRSLRAIKKDNNFNPIIKRMFQEIQPIRVQNNFKEYMNQDFIIKNKKIQELEEIENWYDKELKKIDFNAELEGDLNQAHNVEANQDQMSIQVNRVATLLEPLIQKHLNLPKQSQTTQEDSQEGMEINFNMEDGINTTQQSKGGEKKFQKINFVQQNMKNLTTRKDFITRLLRINKELFIQNIPKLLAKSNFSQHELHSTYILYCALQQITSQRYNYYSCDDGLDYNTYRTGIYQIFMQSEFLAQEIFNKIDLNYSGFLNWTEFLDLMVSIKAKTLVEKINLFIQISDSDGNEMLSYDEIFKLSKVCLSKFIVDSEDFLDMLCEYYTRLIFKVVDREIDDEIPFEDIRNAILSGKEDSDLLCMFCGADI